MEGSPVIERCPNCGAPLEIEDGKCRFCRAVVHEQSTEADLLRLLDESPAADRNLVGRGVDTEAVAAFVYLIVTTLRASLSGEDVVQRFVDNQPGMREQIRTLSAAVGAAGVRVRDSRALRDEYDERVDLYTPDEVWTFDLAVDLVAMASTLPGLPGGSRASLADTVRLLDETRHEHRWKHAVKKAGEGPSDLRGLRARVPAE